MKHIVYVETADEHAERLCVSRNFVLIRRALLKERLGGESTNREIPWFLAQVSESDLMRTLHVRVAPGSDGEVLEPATFAAITNDLRWGQAVYRAMQAGYTWGGQGQSRTALRPPFGYMEGRNGSVVQDPQVAPAIKLAFQMMRTNLTRRGEPKFKDVADALNARGHRRKNNKLYTSDAIREWTRTPAYCGYVKRGWRDTETAYVEPYPGLNAPIVSVSDFVTVARHGREADADWLRHLAEE